MRQWTMIALMTVLHLSCNPKPVVVPGYFTAQRPADAPPTCEQTLACYDRCGPPEDECMLRCEQCAVKREVSLARAVSNCAAIKGCSDPGCREELCTPEVAACRARFVGSPPVIDTFCPKE